MIPASIVGAGVTGGMTMAFSVTSQAPHGGVFVFFAIDSFLLFLLSIVVGTIISALLVLVLKIFVRKGGAAGLAEATAPAASKSTATASTDSGAVASDAAQADEPVSSKADASRVSNASARSAREEGMGMSAEFSGIGVVPGRVIAPALNMPEPVSAPVAKLAPADQEAEANRIREASAAVHAESCVSGPKRSPVMPATCSKPRRSWPRTPRW